MKYLIVSPRYTNSFGRYYEFPLGLAYISSSMKKHGYHVEALNLNNMKGHVEEIIKNAVTEFDIDVICTGGLSMHFNKVKEILDASRSAKKNIRTVIGGGLISSEPALIMDSLRPDFGVIGEGEETIIELAESITDGNKYDTVKGIAYYDSGNKLTINDARSPIQDLDSIPYPDYDGFGMAEYLGIQMPNDEYHLYPFDEPRIIPVIASRSCPYSCTFCFHPLGKKYRQRSLDNFFSELEYLIRRYDINMVSVVDELFSMDKDRISEFCCRIRQYGLKYIAQMRVDSVDKETLKLLRDSGCFVISYGLESTSDKILKSMRKNIKLSQIEKTLKMTYDLGIGIQGNFIFGDRAETWETANKTLDWWHANKKYQINLTPIFTYPGTKLYKNALNEDKITDRLGFLEKGCPQVNVSAMSDEEYGRLMGLISRYSIQYPVPGHVISCNKSGEDELKGSLYTVTVRCPHCLSEVTYGNLHQNCNKMFPLGCRLACRDCNQRFDILPFRIYEYLSSKGNPSHRKDIFSGTKTVSIYGAGLAGSNVYEYCKSKGKEVLYFIDDYKAGKWCGLDIVAPADIMLYPLTDLTIFAAGSEEHLPRLIIRMKEWTRSKTFLYSHDISPETLSLIDEDAMFQYYFEYYISTWLPLLKNGILR